MTRKANSFRPNLLRTNGGTGFSLNRSLVVRCTNSRFPPSSSCGVESLLTSSEIWREKSERQQLQIGAQGCACMWHLAVEASEPLIVATVAAQRPELCG